MIKQVDIYLGEKANGKESMQYENFSSFITLAISDWINKLQLNLGEFNRVLFQEENNDKVVEDDD